MAAAAPATRVVVVSRIHGLAEALRALPIPAAAFELVAPDDPARARDALATAEIVLADPPAIAPLLDACTALQWLHSTYAGP